MNNMNYKHIEHTESLGDSFKKHSKNKKTKKRALLFVALFIVFLIIGAVLYTFYSSQTEDKKIKQAEREVTSLLNDISKISIVPNEDPLVFTISDADLLIKEQSFFVNSQNGDTLLIFPKAMKAVIYSSSRGIIVNMGPVTSEKPIVSEETSGIQEQQVTTQVQEQVEEQDLQQEQNQIIENQN